MTSARTAVPENLFTGSRVGPAALPGRALRTPASALGRRSGSHRAAPAMERSRRCASANLKEAGKPEDMRLNTTRSKVASVAATVAVAALAVTGCSGGNDSPSGEAGGTYPGQLTGAEGTLTIGD